MRQSGNQAILETILADTIPMYGRMIHGKNQAGTPYRTAQLYDPVRGKVLFSTLLIIYGVVTHAGSSNGQPTEVG